MLKMVDRPKKNEGILVLTPDLKCTGGVTNYYNALNLTSFEHIEYFFVNSAKKESKIGVTLRLINNYIKFIKKLRVGGRRSGKFKLVHINPSLDHKSFFRDAMFFYLASWFQVKIVIFFRGWEESYEDKIKYSALHRFIFDRTYKKCKNYIVLSQKFKDSLIEMGVPEEGTNFWIETTVADSSFLDDFDLEQKFTSFKKEVNILFISRVLVEKGIFIALDVYQQVVNEFPERKLRFIVAGDGEDLDKVKQYVETKNIPSVIFTGYVLNEKKKDVLLQSHLMLFPTFYKEGLPNAILEGLMYGMPVISRYNAGIPDVVQHEVNGFLTDSKDAAVFVEYLKILLTDEKLYQQMARTNHAQAIENYGSEKVKARLLSIYDQILYPGTEKPVGELQYQERFSKM